MSDSKIIQPPKLLKTEFVRIVIRFPSPPELTFYMKELDKEALERIWNQVDFISKKYDESVSTKDLSTIFRNKYGIRVVIKAIPKRLVLDYRNIHEHVRTYLKAHTIVIPSGYGNENIYLANPESLPAILNFIEKYKPEIDKLNEDLKRYYETEDFKELLNLIKEVATDIKLDSENIYFGYPKVLVEKIVFDVSSDPRVSQYVKETIKDYLMRIFDTIIDKLDDERIRNVRNLLLRELSKAEKELGIQGLTQFVDELKNKEFSDKALKEKKLEAVKEHLRAEFGEYLDRFL